MRALVPESAVLVLEQDDLAVVSDARGAPRILEQHEREQAEDLGLVGHEHGEELREPDRLVAQVGAHEICAGRRRVALVEHEVEHREDGSEPFGQQVVGRDAEGDARGADLSLRSHEALRHRRLGDEERMRDLGRREATDLAQCQRHAALRGERRVAAREDEGEPVVRDRAHVVLLDRELLQPPDELRLLLEDLLAADPVDRPVPRGRDDPGAGRARHAVARPALESGRERVLHRVLGELEVTEDAREDRDGTAPLLSEDPLDVRLHAGVIAESAGSRSTRCPSPPG